MATSNSNRAYSSLELAKNYIKTENFGRAYAHLLLHFQLVPNSHIHLEKEFVEVTTRWCNELLDRHEVQNARYCYQQAARYFPSNVVLLNDFAAHFLRCEDTYNAIKYFEIAHTTCPNDLATEKNLQSLFAKKVPQWHFRMLNDERRNALYKQAIESTIASCYTSLFETSLNPPQSMKVLDVGTGSGLLTLFASKFVHFDKTIDSNKVQLFAFEESDVLEPIARRVFAQNSANVDLLQGLSTRVSYNNIHHLLITEIFDCCLFGEGALSTLVHAHNHLLSFKSGQVLPHSARLLVFGIECQSIDEKFRYNFTSDDSESTDLKLILSQCIKRYNFEPYDAFNLQAFNYKQLTDINKDIRVEFNDCQQLQTILSNLDAFNEIVLNVEHSGKLHALVICFELILDAQGQFRITTNPLDIACDNYCYCWEQGVVHLNHTANISQGDKVRLNISAVNDKMNVDVKLPALSESLPPHDCFEVDAEALAFLNFNELTATYQKFIHNLRDDWPQSILDLTVIPIFSILLLKHAKVHKKRVNVTVNISKQNAKLVSKLFDLNEVEDQLLTILIDNDLKELLDIENQFDLIVFDPVLPNGLLNEEMYANISGFKHLLKHDDDPMKCGRFLPDKVHVCFEIVHSTYLEKCTIVSDEHLFGLSIAKKFNEFSVNEMRSINCNLLDTGKEEYVKLSQIVKTSIFEANALRETRLGVKMIARGFITGFVYWFECCYGLESVSTYNTAYDQAAFLLTAKEHQETQPVEPDDVVDVKIKQDKGLLKIYLAQ